MDVEDFVPGVVGTVMGDGFDVCAGSPDTGNYELFDCQYGDVIMFLFRDGGRDFFLTRFGFGWRSSSVRLYQWIKRLA